VKLDYINRIWNCSVFMAYQHGMHTAPLLPLHWQISCWNETTKTYAQKLSYNAE